MNIFRRWNNFWAERKRISAEAEAKRVAVAKAHADYIASCRTGVTIIPVYKDYRNGTRLQNDYRVEVRELERLNNGYSKCELITHPFTEGDELHVGVKNAVKLCRTDYVTWNKK